MSDLVVSDRNVRIWFEVNAANGPRTVELVLPRKDVVLSLLNDGSVAIPRGSGSAKTELLENAWSNGDGIRITYERVSKAVAPATEFVGQFDFSPMNELDPWKDRTDEWTPAINAAHPSYNRDSHPEYAVAMRMVGNRHSKHNLVSLVSWLLVRLKAPGKCASVDRRKEAAERAASIARGETFGDSSCYRCGCAPSDSSTGLCASCDEELPPATLTPQREDAAYREDWEAMRYHLRNWDDIDDIDAARLLAYMRRLDEARGRAAK